MEASASSVFTGNQGGQGDGTGRAAILDQHADFLPYAMNIANQVRQDKKLALERQREADKNFKNAVAEVKPETTWQYAQGEIAQKTNELREYMIKEKMAGRDPLDPYSEAGKEVARRRDELASLAYLAKDTEDKFNKALAARVKDPNAYDAEHFNKFIQGLKGKTIAEQAEYINSTNPLRPIIVDTQVVRDTIPAYYSQMLERGAKTTAIEEIREEDYRPILESYLSTPEGEEHFNQGVEDGKWKNEDEYFAEMTKLAQSLKPPQIKETYDEAKVSTAGGSGGGATEKVDMEVTASYNPSFPTERGKTNTITFTPKNQNMKPIILFDGQRQYTATGQLSIHPSSDGKSYVIEADVLSEVSPEEAKQMTYNELEAAKLSGGKKRMTFPIDHRPNFQGNENYRLLSDRSPQEIQNYIGQEIGGKTETKANAPKMSESEWSAAWAKLKSGESMIGLDGKKYVKK